VRNYILILENKNVENCQSTSCVIVPVINSMTSFPFVKKLGISIMSLQNKSSHNKKLGILGTVYCVAIKSTETRVVAK